MQELEPNWKRRFFLSIHNSSIHGVCWFTLTVGKWRRKGKGRNRRCGGAAGAGGQFFKGGGGRIRRRKDLSRSSRTIFFLPYKDLGNPWRTILPSFPKSHVTKSALTYKRTQVGPSSTTDFPKDLPPVVVVAVVDRQTHTYIYTDSQQASQPGATAAVTHMSQSTTHPLFLFSFQILPASS